MNFTEINEEIFYSPDAISKVSRKDIDFLKAKAANNRRKRARLCCHKDTVDPLHEMLIVHVKGAYVRPHKHLGKSESFHIIEGKLKVIIFNEIGDISEVINMAEYNTGEKFYYRLSDAYFHTVVPESEFVVFHEVTNGPFRKEDAIFAPWAPVEEALVEQKKYLVELNKQINKYITNSIR